MVSAAPSGRAGSVRGRLAQLEERLVYTEKVGSSILSPPTSCYKGLAGNVLFDEVPRAFPMAVFRRKPGLPAYCPRARPIPCMLLFIAAPRLRAELTGEPPDRVPLLIPVNERAIS